MYKRQADYRISLGYHQQQRLLPAPDVYKSQAFDRLSPGAVVLDFSGLLKALQSGDIAMISAQMANMLEPAAMSLCPETVSYTHLDVYKRQVLLLLCYGFSGGCSNNR